MLGEFFSSKNEPNGLIFGQWVDMGKIQKITEEIWDSIGFMVLNSLIASKRPIKSLNIKKTQIYLLFYRKFLQITKNGCVRPVFTKSYLRHRSRLINSVKRFLSHIIQIYRCVKTKKISKFDLRKDIIIFWNRTKLREVGPVKSTWSHLNDFLIKERATIIY